MQTQFPFALTDTDPATSAYIEELYSLQDAYHLTRMSRTEFYRLRRDSAIRVVPGQRVHGADIIRVFERFRGLTGNGPYATLREYSAKLLKRWEVCAKFGMKITSLYKLRVRHQVPLLPGGTFHSDDIIAALEAERRGERRAVGIESFRVMTRVRRLRKVTKAVAATGYRLVAEITTPPSP